MVDKEDEHELLLSGIQHFQFCKRQWALIHIEQQWAEDVRTVEGQHLHRKADQPFVREKRGDKLIVRGMPVTSRKLGVTGVCDVVEFIRSEDGIPIQGLESKYKVIPVEYKRGKPKKNTEDIVQLAAQALCLEEMLLCNIEVGYMYYHEIRHRKEVPFSEELKSQVMRLFGEMHDYYQRGHTPRVKTGPHCRSCSLQHICLPELMNKRSVKGYIEEKIKE